MEMQEKKVGTRCAESGWEDTKVEPSRLHNISAVEDTEFTASEMQTQLGCISYL